MISSRTPEGEPNRCPVCGKRVAIEPSRQPGDAPCPHCGHLLWFVEKSLRQGTPKEVRVLTPLTRDLDDELAARAWQDEVLAAIGQSPRVVLNLSCIEFMSSSALGVFVRLHGRLREKGGSLRLCCLHSAPISAGRNSMRIYVVRCTRIPADGSPATEWAGSPGPVAPHAGSGCEHADQSTPRSAAEIQSR